MLGIIKVSLTTDADSLETSGSTTDSQLLKLQNINGDMDKV